MNDGRWLTQRRTGVRNAPVIAGVTVAGKRPSLPSLNAPSVFSGSARAAAMPVAAPWSFASRNACWTTCGVTPTLWNCWSLMNGPEWQRTQSPRPTKTAAPRCAARESGAPPCIHASNALAPQESSRSKAPMALPALTTTRVTAVWFGAVMPSYSAWSPGEPWKVPSHVGCGSVGFFG